MSKKVLHIVIIIVVTTSLCLAIFNPVHTASAEDISEWKLVGQIGGSTQAVAVMGRTAFTGTGLKMNIISFSNPANPMMLGSTVPFTDFVQDIAAYGSRAYVADGKGGLSVVDVKDLSNPKVLGTWNSSGYAEGVAVRGSLVAVADGPIGLRLLDVSIPTNPKEVGFAYSMNYAMDVALSGNYAFVAAGDSGLLVVDLSDPANPKELGQLDTDGYAYEIVVKGSIAYIADAWEGIATVDITHPEAPALIGSTPSNGWALSLAISGTLLCSGNGGMGTQVFDISDPKIPKATGVFSIGGTSRKVAASGKFFYVADTLKGLRMIDASNPAELTQAGIFGLLPYARRATLNGDYLYVASGADGAMYVINVADPTHPYQTSKFQADGNASDVPVSGNTAYLTTFMDSTNYLTAIDISDPTNLKEKSLIPLGSLTPMNAAAREAVIQDNILFVADEFGLRIFDISNPAKIIQTGQIELNANGNVTDGLVVSGDFAYVTGAGGGVHVVDISDLNNPRKVQTFDRDAGSVALAGNTLYIGKYGQGVQTASITSGGAGLSSLGRMASPGQVEGITISDTSLFVNVGMAGVQVLDVNNPAKMKQTQLLTTPGYAWDSVVAGDMLYQSDGNGGLLIFKRGGTTAAAVSDSATPKSAGPTASSASNTTEAPNYPPSVGKATSSETCTVTSTDFMGPGTLFNCIRSIQSGGTINFDTSVFSPKNPTRIVLENDLPQLATGSVTIDASNAGVILDGNHNVSFGLVVGSSYNTIMGLEFTNFTNGGIQVGFPSMYNIIGGDHFIGEGPSGQGNTFNNSFSGIVLIYCSNNIVKGNFVGTNAGGTQAGQYMEQGISIGNWATYNQIGGKSEGEKNIISGTNRGIDLASNSSMYNIVAGNYVGTDITGTKAIPNYSFGVLLEVGTRFNTIGGTSNDERNIISGNAQFGLTVSDDETTQNTVIGNYIGLDVSGTKALPNKTGMTIYTAMFNRLGGSLPGEGNLISGNKENALAIFGMSPINAIVMGNRFGLDANEKALPNGSNINIYGGTHSFIGGVSIGSGNLINGGQIGIRFESTNDIFNWAAGNTISGTQTGILVDGGASHTFIIKNSVNKSEAGITLNASNFNTLRGNLFSGTSIKIKLDAGANESLAAPLLNSVTASSVSGTTCPFCIVDIFSDTNGQGVVYEGFSVADVSGNFIFSKSLTGLKVSATATDLSGNTSTFSQSKGFQ